jgi:hypothetical protein
LLLQYVYGDVKQAKLSFEVQLHEQRIPYDKGWSACKAFTGGCFYYRVTSRDGHLSESIDYPMIGNLPKEQMRAIQDKVPNWTEQARILRQYNLGIPDHVLNFIANFYGDVPVSKFKASRKPGGEELTPVTISLQ